MKKLIFFLINLNNSFLAIINNKATINNKITEKIQYIIKNNPCSKEKYKILDEEMFNHIDIYPRDLEKNTEIKIFDARSKENDYSYEEMYDIYKDNGRCGIYKCIKYNKKNTSIENILDKLEEYKNQNEKRPIVIFHFDEKKLINNKEFKEYEKKLNIYFYSGYKEIPYKSNSSIKEKILDIYNIILFIETTIKKNKYKKQCFILGKIFLGKMIGCDEVFFYIYEYFKDNPNILLQDNFK